METTKPKKRDSNKYRHSLRKTGTTISCWLNVSFESVTQRNEDDLSTKEEVTGSKGLDILYSTYKLSISGSDLEEFKITRRFRRS